MYETTNPPELKALKAALAESDAFKVKVALEELYPAQILEHWSEFPPEHRLPILTLLSPADAAEVFSHLEEAEQAELLEALPPWRVKEILEELSLDDLADAINAVEEEKSPEAAEALLRQLDPETRAEVEELTEYEEDQAGGIMTPEYIAVRDGMRVEEVFRFLRREAPDAEQIYVIYVVDEEERLQGVLTLRDLIVADPKTRVAEIMNPDVIYVRDDTDQEEVARLMADYNFTVLPVVDEEKKLVGIVTIDDVVDVIQEEATEDIYRLGAVESPELVYSRSSIWTLWSARVRWLIILIITGSITSTILQGFESVLEAVTALAFYVPVLVGTGGNTGNQSSTLIVRALATRDVGLGDWLRILRKELGVGLLLGLTLATLLSGKVLLDGQAQLLLVVGVSLGLVVLLANVVGAMLPLLLRRLGLDPALISNPLIATVTDVTGLIVYLSVARMLLGL
ncbi:MAG: magnesium transporter [Meiothermus sp.]|uniref:magnesium transporter n=1 Tax=Meiothermus sp. TaxID=1955249 RepID=UPI0025CE1AF4|nr:magnesium transporter [Meiothermus sp.]MCS7058401.1 magnesium transporter [Meiothermus sp.]MCS7195449.1 magnesium transporter [Meiothermus sp.]MCX7740921.1 magnesium transporter [Meiothermus sp.]MDW8089811.1 magnesium transporter [Meiothermus sp.]MDW8481764.1 magnesium transporter [Meiothermus sp.]